MLEGGKFAAEVRDHAPQLLSTCSKAQRDKATRSCRGQHRWDLQERSRHFPSPQKPADECPECFSEPPLHCLAVSKEPPLGLRRVSAAIVLDCSSSALPSVLLNGSNSRPAVMAPGRPSHRLINSLQELAAWLLLAYH